MGIITRIEGEKGDGKEVIWQNKQHRKTENMVERWAMNV